MPNSLPRIFLSYSRTDRDFAVSLRDELIAAGHAVWQDLTDLEAGQWWSQIADALEGKSIEHIVLIASPNALASTIVAQECWLAQREGKTASLVIPRENEGKIDFKRLPRFMQAAHHYRFIEEAQKAKFIERLREPGQGPRRPRPEGHPKPAHYVARDNQYGQMRGALLDADDEATTATVVLSGFGGFGKTTLATAFVNDEAVQQAYFNGIMLVELGEGLAKLPKTSDGRKTLEGMIKSKIEALIKTLEPEDEMLGRLDELQAAKNRLAEVLAKRHGAVLLWIDDAWDAGHARHFIAAAPNAAKLVTTRIRDIIPDASACVYVDELTDAEAAAFMGWGLQPANDTERTGLRELSTITAGRWPILIRQVNAQLRNQTTAQSDRKAVPLGDAIAALRRRLKSQGLDDLDKSTDTNRATAVRLSVGVSFEMLLEEDRHRKYPEGFHEARYLDLAGFQEEKVPIATIARLWAHLGALKSKSVVLDAKDEAKRDAQEAAFREAAVAESVVILERLYALALLQSLDATDDNGMVQLHDVMRTYLGEVQGDDARNKFHRQFVLAYDADSGEQVSDMGERERRYFYAWYPTHLAEADKIDRDRDQRQRPFSEALNALLLDPRWMQRKLAALSSPLPLIADYRAFAPYDAANQSVAAVVGRALSLAAGALARDEYQLVTNLLGRLRPDATPGVGEVRSKARSILRPPALVPRCPTLTSAEGPLLRTFEREEIPISAIALSPDGRRIVLGSWDGTLRFLNTETGLVIGPPLEGHGSKVFAVSFSPDGRRIVSGSYDRTLRLWDSATGAALGDPLDGHEGEVMAVAFSPDGRLVASGSWDGTLRVWDAATGAEIGAPLEGHGDPVSAIAFSTDGQRIISGSYDHTLRIWDAATGAPIGDPLEGHGEPVLAVAVSPDGRLIASGSYDRTLRLWEAASGATIGAPLEGHKGSVTAVAFSPQGRWIVSGSTDSTLRLWKAATRTAVGSPLDGHGAEISTVVFSPDGRRIVSGSEDRTVRVWDTNRATVGFTQKGHRHEVSAVAFSPVDRRIISSSWDGTLRFWDAETGAAIGVPLEGHGGVVSAIAFSPDGRRIVSGSWDGTLRLWDSRTGAAICAPIQGNSGEVKAIAYSPDGRRIAAGFGDRTLRLWDAATGVGLGAALKGYGGENTNDTWTPNGQWVQFSPDGKCIVSGAGDHSLRLWDAETRAEIGTPLKGHKDDVTAIAFALDGRRIVSSSFDRTLRLWDAVTGMAIGVPLTGHDGRVSTVAFSADGQRIFSGSDDRTLRVWDAETGAEHARFEADASIGCIAISRNEIAVGDRLGRVHILDWIPNTAAKSHWLAKASVS